MYQYEAVVKVMKENGGYATLKHLYKHAPRVESSEWETNTPNASIRRIVQRRERFFKLKPGLWGLESHREDLPKHIGPGVDGEGGSNYSHWYFQGLLAEVGNTRAADTWVPAQDKNRPFLGETLGDVRSLDRMPQFGHEERVARAQTVDVVWFNERRMPDSLLEVEFSTDPQNSLHKFLDLQDYHANFVIVADETRKGQFEKRLGQAGFEPIRDRVDFLNFEEVSTLHAATDDAHRVVQKLA